MKGIVTDSRMAPAAPLIPEPGTPHDPADESGMDLGPVDDVASEVGR